MPKTVTSKVSGFEGQVVLHDPLNMEQVFAIEEAQDAATEIEPSKFLTKVNELRGVKGEDGQAMQLAWSSKSDATFIPAILLCVKEWRIDRMSEPPTAETFPFTPRKDASEFIDWLWSEITKIYQGEVEIPNES